MTQYISLLRGINVNGKNKIQMSQLAELYALLGFEKIVTYIQSGNVVFESKLKKGKEIAELIEKGIKKQFGLSVPVLVLEKKEFEGVIKRNPFLKDKSIDASKLHVTFLEEEPVKENLNKIAAIEGGKDKIIIASKTAYLYCPIGYGRTKYTNTVIENRLKVKATTRNWKTITAISELL